MTCLWSTRSSPTWHLCDAAPRPHSAIPPNPLKSNSQIPLRPIANDPDGPVQHRIPLTLRPLSPLRSMLGLDRYKMALHEGWQSDTAYVVGPDLNLPRTGPASEERIGRRRYQWLSLPVGRNRRVIPETR